ncbi:MAG: hypothetical protein M3Y13_05820 [Armatimonadota bacterium]|nr:hypothetical protein [Armatimonadota bacterium]
MTLTLTPDAAERLRSVAAQRGQTPEEAISTLLTEAEEDFAVPLAMSEEEAQQVLAALQKSEEDFAAGRWISLEDYEAQIKEQRRTRRAENAAA